MIVIVFLLMAIFKVEPQFWHNWGYCDPIKNIFTTCYRRELTAEQIQESNTLIAEHEKREAEQRQKLLEKAPDPKAICPSPNYRSPNCPKVPTRAKNIHTGEIKEFPDGCLPECWLEIQ